MWDNIKYTREDWKEYYPLRFWGGIFGIIAVIILGIWLSIRVPVGYDKNGDPKENSNEQITQLKKDSKTLRKTFSELNVMDVSTDKNHPILQISLFLKNPYVTQDDLSNDLNLYIKTLKTKYNSGKKKEIRAIRFDIYDRKIVYDKGLTPRATAYYMRDSLDVLKENKKDEQEQERANATADTNTYIWQKTVEETKRPNYDDYTLNISGFTAYDANTNALSDEEFAFFLKLKLYSAIAGSDTAAAQLYLKWDLGASLDSDGQGLMVDEITDFMEREYNTGDKTEYYDNPDLLKQSLAVQRPQFLLFATTDELQLNRLDAQKELIKNNSDLYKDVIAEDASKRAKSIKKDGTSSYKEGKDFNATTGTMAKKQKNDDDVGGLRTRTTTGTGDDDSSLTESDSSTRERSVDLGSDVSETPAKSSSKTTSSSAVSQGVAKESSNN